MYFPHFFSSLKQENKADSVTPSYLEVEVVPLFFDKYSITELKASV